MPISWLSLCVVLGGSSAAAGQDLPQRARQSDWPPDAFADAGARELVRRALELRDSAAAGLASYEATATERMHVRMQVTRRLPLRSRTLYHREQVARVYWQQNGDHRVRWLGRREGKPVMGDDFGERAPFGLDFDIADELDLDDINIDMLFNPLGDRMDAFEANFVQPISAPGLRLYRFASGDTMQIRLPDRTITLIEVIVRPRRVAWEAVEGSLWFDRDAGILARAAFRPSDVWDMEAREPGNLDDVPGFIKPAIGTVTSIVIEYGLFEQRWWLPRRVIGEGVFDWGRGLVRMPLVIEWTMTGHVVNEAASPDVTPGPGLRTRGWGRESVNGRREQTSYLVEEGIDLAESPLLPPPLFEGEPLAFTRAELEPLIARIAQVAGPAPLPASPALLSRLLYSLRYDRVRGPSAGTEWAVNAGSLRIGAAVRVAPVVPEVFGEVAASRGVLTATLYHRLADASDWNHGDGLGNTMATLLFGHDGGDWYRASGFSLGLRATGERTRARIEAFAEAERRIDRHTSVSLATIGGGSLRPNVAADNVDLTGVRAEIAGQLGSDVQKAVFNWRAWGESTLGDTEYGRLAAALRITGSPGGRLATAVEVMAGLAGKGAPVQRNFQLGGVATLRGVTENAVRGPAFWLARIEAGTSLPGLRTALFLDTGWAGARNSIATSRPVAGTGVGASFMDGLFRVDLARGIVRADAWRLYFYLDALL